jgi:hypothetical protein
MVLAPSVLMQPSLLLGQQLAFAGFFASACFATYAFCIDSPVSFGLVPLPRQDWCCTAGNHIC